MCNARSRNASSLAERWQHLGSEGPSRQAASVRMLTPKQILSSAEPLSLSTPSNVRVGPFARQAQVSHVLDILMMQLRDPNANATLDKEESDQIARTLTAFSLLLPEETPQPWPRYCGAIGMCYRRVPKSQFSTDLIRNL